MLLRAIVSRLRELGEGSSLHGLPKIVSSNQVVFKIFWTVIVIGASVLLGLQLQALYQEFTKYPTKMSITIEYGRLEFPSVTVCNNNPLKRSKLDYFPNATAIIRGEQQSDDAITRNPADPKNAGESGPPPSDDIVTRNHAGLSNEETSESPLRHPNRETSNNPQGPSEERPSEDFNKNQQQPTSKPGNESNVAEGPMRSYNTVRRQLLIALRDANQTDRLLHGHDKTDLILMAMFRESILPLTYMEPVLTPEHGTCYTINVDKDVIQAGPKGGLKLVLFLDKDKYIEEASDGYGMKVQTAFAIH